MSGAFHHIAVASLPVAVGLLALAAVARIALWADLKDERPGEYLGPLSTWCLILVAVHAVALGGAGDLGAGSMGAALVIGAGAVLLRAEGDAEEESDDAPEWAVAAAPASTPRQAAPHPLWAEGDDEAAPRTGLWT